ncbi:MAG: PAS domain S-box protein [Myxococcales bacterium]|nr:PAS domain S-box protein [Myxococcales bacterium]
MTTPMTDRDLDVLRSDALYRALFDVNTAIKFIIDPLTSAIVDANQAAVDFYGWSLDELRAMHITDINLLTAEEVQAEMENARTLRRSYFRFRHRTASGDVRSVEVHSGPLTIKGHDLLFSIVHDVTERDQLEEHLRRAQRLDAIGQLAGGVAHDFNNLLTVVLGAARLLRGRLGAGHAGLRLIDDIDQAAQRGAELSRALLAFSRRQVMTPRPIRLEEVASSLIPLLSRSLGTAHAVTLEVAGAPPPVVADPVQIEQVLMNLVLNARDATDQGGEIKVRVGVTDEVPAGVPPGRWATLEVIDQGVGIDAATQARVFEPFFTTKREGTGLGLATVYGVVVQSGGHVAIASAPGQGTTFTVYLPPSESAPDRAVAAPVATPRPRTATVLLVDDVPQVRHAVGALLRSLGHRVVVASSCDDALAQVDGARLDDIDVVVTDVVMPGRSGVELLQELLGRRPDLPSMVVSGDLRDQALAPLPDHVVRLGKPFTLEELEEALARAMERA